LRKSARHGSGAGFSPGENSKAYSRSEDAMIRVYDDDGNVIETREHKGDFKEP
jgi:hypothetical protein